VRDLILSKIIKNVNKSGSYEIPLREMEEHVFVPTQKPYRSTAEQILIWSVENEVLYEYRNNGKDAIVRFFKKAFN
jgi:hypothetical protein